MRADLRLAAWLRWMMPRAAALSSLFTASRKSSAAVSSPTSAAWIALLILVLTSDLAALLRRRRFSLVPMRFIWLLIFATGFTQVTSSRAAGRGAGPMARRGGPGSACGCLGTATRAADQAAPADHLLGQTGTAT